LIRKVLRAMQDSHYQSKREVADRVGVQESTLESILSMLSDKGYLHLVNNNRELPARCVGCTNHQGCKSMVQQGRVYLITNKGRKLLVDPGKRLS